MQKFLEGMCLSLTFFFLELFGSGPGCFFFFFRKVDGGEMRDGTVC